MPQKLLSSALCILVLVSWPCQQPGAESDPAADRLPQSPGEPASRAPARPHAVYLEIFGKAGLYSVGYDYMVAQCLGAGGSLSAYRIGSQRILSAASYINVYPVRWQRHRWLLQAGAQLMQRATRSPLPEWPDSHSTGVSGYLSAGYEHRSRMVARVFLTTVAGRGGVALWAGLNLGVTL